MTKSTRRPQRLYSIIMWVLSIVFAGFLIGLGNLVMRDIPQVENELQHEQFVSAEALSANEQATDEIAARIRELVRQREDAERQRQSAQADRNSAATSFENWLKTRTATENSAQNPEVIRRTREVEQLRETERAALRKVEALDQGLVNARRQEIDFRKSRSALFDEAQPQYDKARRSQELRVFLLRLALTLPLLLIAGWLLLKKRNSAHWPLFRGFVLFAAFAFFVELVPYLPSYGGYVRYGVGILTVIIAGHFIINGMRQYTARKQAEEKRSEGERRQGIEYETALKKIAASTCPGCDRAIVTREGIDTDFCVHCGIRLQEKCGACGERNISFHRFCLACGAACQSSEVETVSSAGV